MSMFSPGTGLCLLRAFRCGAKAGGGPPSLWNNKKQELIIQVPRLEVLDVKSNLTNSTREKEREDTVKTSFRSNISQL